jgi:hypothetical protein
VSTAKPACVNSARWFLPARVADQHLRLRVQALEEIGPDLQAARAAEGLHGGDAAVAHGRALRAEDEALHGLVVGGDAVDRQVAARLGRLIICFSRRGTQASSGSLPFSSVYTPTPRLTLAGWVGVELFVQAQDRVTRGEFDGGKQ